MKTLEERREQFNLMWGIAPKGSLRYERREENWQWFKLQLEEEITGETSDGFHTFDELYEFRKLFNAVLFNEWFEQGKYKVHKSWKHNDGEKCFGGGWFIVMATLPTGQISNHYEEEDWDLFKCEERKKADKWDGHTAKDVAKRLSKFTLKNSKEEK